MKSNLLKYMFLGTAIIISSCSSLLSIDDENILLADKHYKNINDVNAAVIGIYSQMQVVAPQVILVNEIRGGVLELNQPNSDIEAIINNQVSDANPYLNIRAFYKIIASCNDILSKIDAVVDRDPSFTHDVCMAYRAEIIGVRTWVYLQISKIFGTAAYYSNAINGKDDIINKVDLTPKEMVDQLILDFIPYMDQFQRTFDSSYDETWRASRLTQYGARVLAAELYMYQGAFESTSRINTYKKAKEQLWYVMSIDSTSTSTQRYKVGETYSSTKWQNIFKGVSSGLDEIVWAIDYNKTMEQTHVLHLILNSEPILLPVAGISSIWGSSDTRKSQSIIDGKVAKYSYGKQKYESDAPIVLYRAADIQLMYAEVLNRLGESALALSILNSGYSQREMTPTGEKTYNAKSIGVVTRSKGNTLSASEMSDTESVIFEERVRELAFEGKSWSDIVRKAIIDNKTEIEVNGVAIQQNDWYIKH